MGRRERDTDPERYPGGERQGERAGDPGESCHLGPSRGQAAKASAKGPLPRPSQGPVPAGTEHRRLPASPLLPAARCVRPVTGCTAPRGSRGLTAVPTPSLPRDLRLKPPVHPLPLLPRAPPGRTRQGPRMGGAGALLLTHRALDAGAWVARSAPRLCSALPALRGSPLPAPLPPPLPLAAPPSPPRPRARWPGPSFTLRPLCYLPGLRSQLGRVWRPRPFDMTAPPRTWPPVT